MVSIAISESRRGMEDRNRRICVRLCLLLLIGCFASQIFASSDPIFHESFDESCSVSEEEDYKDYFSKFFHTWRFQRSVANTHDIESISKARHDKNGADPSNPCGNGSNEPNDTHTSYNSWLNEHPSALRSFEGMMSIAKGNRIVVFLDYDGTLSPIVDDPDRAFMSDPMRSAVREIARQFPTAIISGRSRDKVYEFVKLDEVFYAGSHGMDIRGPPRQLRSYDDKYQTSALDEKGNEFIIFQPAQEFLPAIKDMLKELENKTNKIQGVMIEDNRFCISVHYRHVQEEDYVTLQEKVQSVLATYPQFHLTRGKKVMEIRPSIEWNKGHALEYLLETLGFASSSNTLPIYIGDDWTDEDAFRVLRSRGVGYPIIVSSTPRDTMALYSLRDPSEVLSFLIRLARWGGSSY
ncbi:Trehalose-phosphate phosphatase [Actinidia chinensis var. chinensis]|uniref:Trehalose 6-phosphate phosphatase n=1 Tax=Actinidia chinensis var. chinensis TaxID=1590841 RepID=A0A2R6RFJ7_ACTCC|nr:Trehalose-phosphate phosphatase [Actinidia chinensis var. chinensis]